MAKMAIDVALRQAALPSAERDDGSRIAGQACGAQWYVMQAWIAQHVDAQLARHRIGATADHVFAVMEAMVLVMMLREEFHATVGTIVPILSGKAERRAFLTNGCAVLRGEAEEAAAVGAYVAELLDDVPQGLTRDIVGCMPLRADDVYDDDSQLQLRHKSLFEFAAARWAAKEARFAAAGAPRRVPPLLLRLLQSHVPEALDLRHG
eukprot:gene15769-11469_t